MIEPALEQSWTGNHNRWLGLARDTTAGFVYVRSRLGEQQSPMRVGVCRFPMMSAGKLGLLPSRTE